MKTLYVVLPAYNEEANIDAVVKEWHPIIEKILNNSKLVVVDDGSTDSTYQKLIELTNNYPHLIALTKPNTGHGSTCLFAYNYSIENNAEFVFQTDSDGQTSAKEFWEFWEKRNDYNFIIGTRFNRKDGLSRLVVANVLKLVIFLMLGIKVKDANTPFRLMKAQSLKDILRHVPKDFFLSNALISMLVVLRKESLQWLPIHFNNRRAGKNSINMMRIFQIGIKSVSEFRNFKRSYKKQNDVDVKAITEVVY